MADELSSAILKKRLAIWAIGQALPESSALQPHIKAAITSVALAAAAGTLAVIGLLAAFSALYFYLVDIGITSYVSLGFIATVILVLALILYAYARSKVHVVANVSENTSLFSHNNAAHEIDDNDSNLDGKALTYEGDDANEIVGEIVADVVGSFIDGIFGKNSTNSKT